MEARCAEEVSWHETRIRIRYKDTDRMGLVYYGNYFTFFEVARSEYMRALGYPYAKVEAEGYGLVVTEATAQYHGNTRYDAMITVRTRAFPFKRIRVRFEYRIFDEEGRLLVSGHTVHACINSEQKPTRLPPKLKAILEKGAAC
ncbi:MAG: acyl-CoA thioesterase [Deltaproteobacteria bacterium]|nr:acyl-CoA thioesterase [Deltaproteobacteria bacterium]MBW2015782.1 acyl-CoA thioesterase [Deltaproteobacteria bacterium]MBW2128666.1 acyl-CoA thioesterase [Deltaproteobacteria bacterium]MBW2302645.1 acyl-CoA thioesterase [Deltaproteobacteria bacterium]